MEAEKIREQKTKDDDTKNWRVFIMISFLLPLNKRSIKPLLWVYRKLSIVDIFIVLATDNVRQLFIEQLSRNA
jgi:hypothetical protein